MPAAKTKATRNPPNYQANLALKWHRWWPKYSLQVSKGDHKEGNNEKMKGTVMKSSNGKIFESRGYAPVNGLKMYYEIEGTGDPLVYIPPAFGYAGVCELPLRNRQVIIMDLQGHGRTADIPERPLSMERHAKDVIGLLEYLKIAQADFFGWSFGGIIASSLMSSFSSQYIQSF